MQRERLVDLLRQATASPLTIVQAPAGYGKSEAVAQFAAAVDTPVTWYDVTEMRGQALPSATELAGSDDVIVVFEDLQAAEPQQLGQFRQLVLDLPEHVHLLATTRHGLPLPVARWRLEGIVAEVGLDDLRFRPDETATLLTGTTPATPDQYGAIRLVTERTEGWVAGLLLFTDDGTAPGEPVRLRLDPDPTAGAALLDEVIGAEPPDVQEFLVTTSILFSVTGELCQAVTGRPDAARMLDHLRAANLLLLPLDDEHVWYRYQRLFAELLRARLREQRTHEEVRNLHRRAATWLREHGGQDAVGHLAAAGEGDAALRMLASDVNLIFHDGRSHGTDWSTVFPAEWVAEDPVRMVYVAMVLTRSGWNEHAAVWLDQADEALRDRPEDVDAHALLLATRSLWHGINGEADLAVRLGTRALDLMDDPVASPVGRRVLVTLVFSYTQRWELGKAAKVVEALDDPRVPDVVRGLMVPAFRAQIGERIGHMQEAERDARAALQVAELYDLPFHAAIPEAHAALANVLVEWGQLEDAEAHALAAVESYGNQGWSVLSALHQAELARIRAVRGGSEAGLAVIEQLRADVAPEPLSPTVRLALDPLEARLRLAVGELDRAEELVAGMPDGPWRSLLTSGLALARGDLRAAEQALPEESATDRYPRARLAADLLGAQIAAARNDDTARDRFLLAAAELGVQHGFVLSFITIGPRLLGTLRALADRRGHLTPLLTAIDGLLHDMSSTRQDQGLSRRELSVLRYLPSDLSNREIAAELDITPNTLKTHLRSLYRKLDVSSRTAAVEAARALGLLK